MYKRKKWWTSLLALSLTGSLLAGCSGKAEPESQASSGSSINSPNANEPVKLKVVLYGDMKADSKRVFDVFNQKLQLVLPNTTVDFDLIDGPSYNGKTQLMVAGGEAFDLMWAADWKGQAYDKVAGGAFMPIKDLVDKYGQGLRKQIPASAWGAGEVNGVLYAVPSYQTIYSGKSFSVLQPYYDQFASLVDKDKIDKMANDFNVSFVDILKQMEPMLDKIHASEKTLATVGAINEGVWHNFDPLYTSAGVNLLGLRKGEKSLKVYDILETPEYKQWIELARVWNQKGYFPKDLASFLKLPNNKVGSVTGVANANPPRSIYTEAELKAKDQQSINFNGHTFGAFSLAPDYISASSGLQGMFVSKNSKHADRAIQFLNALVSNPDLYNLFAFGEKDTDYKIDPNGAVNKDTNKYDMRDWLIGNTDLSLNNVSQKDVLKKINDLNAKAPVAPISGFKLSIDNVKTEVASVTAILNEYMSSLNFGMYDNPDAKYNEFIGKLKSAGIDKIVQEAQKQMDDLAKAKGLK